MTVHKCEKQEIIESIKASNERYYKVLYGNGQPGLISTIFDLTNNVKTLHESIPELKQHITTLLDYKASEIAVKVERREKNNLGWTKASIYIAAIVGISGIMGSYISKVSSKEVTAIVKEVTKEQENIIIEKEQKDKAAKADKQADSILHE